MKILVAEDNMFVQKVISRFMDFWGFEFDLAVNGKEAVNLAKINRGEYDLCLMDIDMPIMNGCEATKVIRRELKYLPIMAVSGNLEFKGKHLEAGMDDFLEKPYQPERLYNRILELTIKAEHIVIKNRKLYIKKDLPMDQKHAQELRELMKKNLRKVKFFDSPGSILIVHKNVTNKISHDFIVEKHLVTTFINRDPEKPTKCELYKESNYLMPQTFLYEEEYNDLTKQEDQELEKYPNLEVKEIKK